VLRAVIGIAISLGALAFVLRSVDLARTAEVMRSASPGWLALMAAFLVADVLFRALRWQRLIEPIHPVRYSRMLAYLLVGYLANNVLPARLGELVRSHYLGDREGISRTATLGTVVVERVVDTAVVVLIAAFAIFVLSVRGVVASAVLIGLAVAGVLVVGLGVALAAHRLPGADRAMAIIDRWPRVRELGGKLRDGLAVAGRPRTIGSALLLSIAAWSMSVLAFAAAGQSVGIQLTIGQAALLAAGVALATAIPSGPGYLGTFELAAVKIAEVFGIDSHSAFALALLAHAGILLVTSAGGVIALARLGWVPMSSSRSSGGASAVGTPDVPTDG
jgi:uncharacterized protein (TIRG00374 family)